MRVHFLSKCKTDSSDEMENQRFSSDSGNNTFEATHMYTMSIVCIRCTFSVLCLYTLWCVRVFLVFSVVFFALAHIAMQEHIHSTQQHSLNFNAFKRIIFRAIQVSVCYRFFASLFLLIRILFAWSYIVPQPPSTTYRCNCTVTVHAEFCELFLERRPRYIQSIQSMR